MAHMNCKEHAPNYVKCISELQSTFNERFHDFHLLEHNIIFVMQRFSVEVKDAPTDLQMILIDLQYNKFVKKKVDKILIRNLVRILLQICTF